MLHETLKECIDAQCASALLGPVELRRDALVMRLANGVDVEMRFASAEEYAIAWRWGDAQMRIDTAPLHDGPGTAPNHLHDSAGAVRSDPLTAAGDEPLVNARRVIAALVSDPLLQAHIDWADRAAAARRRAAGYCALDAM